MKLTIHTYHLQTRKVFTTSHGSAAYRRCLIIELSHEGLSGYGEATEILYYGKNLERMIQLVRMNTEWIESMDIIPPGDRYQEFLARFKEDRFVLCALDMAYHDLYGKLKGKSLIDLWGLDIESCPLSSLTVGIDDTDAMLNHIDQNPWPVYKIKLGTDHDLDIMKAIRKHTDKPLRVDVNEGWTPSQTIEYAPILKSLNIEFIEQPLPASLHHEMIEVFKQSPLPLFADESCHIPEDVEKCVGHFDGINIKLMKCGGLTPAIAMIQMARQLELKIMIGCMTESSVGISALAQILPLVDYADLDGSMLISNDPARGVYLDYGIAVYPETNGTGAELLIKNPFE
ncbi:MAG: dipeptide epimerase [Saprospiraceae bacterium]